NRVNSTGMMEGPSSPNAADEIREMTVPAIVSLLKQWTPFEEFMSPSQEGLSRELSTVVAQEFHVTELRHVAQRLPAQVCVWHAQGHGRRRGQQPLALGLATAARRGGDPRQPIRRRQHRIVLA